MSKIKSPLRYPGGKSRASDYLVGCFPSFSEYREPFFGGGSVFFSAVQSIPMQKMRINDLYYDLYCFWDSAKNNIDELVDRIYELKNAHKDGRELFAIINENMRNYTGVDMGAAFFIMNRITFSGTSMSGGYSDESFRKRFTESSIQRVKEASPLLKDVVITNRDYSDLLSMDGEDVFIFLDPPYYTATQSALYGNNGELHKGFDHVRFCENVKRCKHKFMITYDDCEYIRNLYKDYNIEPFNIVYGMKNTTGKEIKITNYTNEHILYASVPLF